MRCKELFNVKHLLKMRYDALLTITNHLIIKYLTISSNIL